MMMSNAYQGGGSSTNLDIAGKQNQSVTSQSNPSSSGSNTPFLTNHYQNQMNNYAALAAAVAAGVNLNSTNNRGISTPPITNSNISNGNPGGLGQLNGTNRLQQNLLNFNNPAPNSQMNNSLLNSTIARPQQINPQLMSTDPSYTGLDPSDFPVLHRNSHSPFQQLQQQTQLQQLQQQLRNNNFVNGPVSAPILSSASAQNLILQFANSMSSSTNNLSNSANAANMLMMMNNNNNNLAQFSSNFLLQHQNSNQTGSGKMWSNFNSSKDLRFKTQQSGPDHQEFNIQQEDFPALPRPQSVHNKSDSQTNLSGNIDLNLKSSLTNLADSNQNSPTGLSNSSSNVNLASKPLSTNQNVTNTSQNVQNAQQQQLQQQTTTTGTSTKKGILISQDGRIKNVPPNMLLDQFGIVGLLAYLRSADREKDIYTLALGTDLTGLGLNLNSNENLYHSFLSPFSDAPCRLQDIDFPVPTEYIINFQIKDKLAPIDLTRYHEDTLFYLFYMNGGDMIQLQAAAALFDHDWRYHTEKRLWLTKVPGLEPHQKDGLFERGIYTLFDVSQWRKVQMEMSIEYSKLAEKPQLPPYLLQQQQQQSQLAQSSNPSTSILPSVLQQQLQQQAFTAAGLNPNNPNSLASLTSANQNQTRSY